MHGKALLATLLAATLTCSLNTTSEAQTRVFVSVGGSDNNACTFAKPCRNFQKAHDTVALGGEIDVLDPGGYGTLLITKAISVQGYGIAGITGGAGTSGITINAAATDQINLRGLLIDGASSGNTAGILFNTGASLNVQESVIRTNGTGILFLANLSSSLFVSDTLIADNQSSGILVQPSGSVTVTVDLDHVRLENNHDVGFASIANAGIIQATFSNSVAAHNGSGGINCFAAPGARAVITVANSTLSNSGNFGLESVGLDASIWVTRSRITGNINGLLVQSGAVILSYGDNTLNSNAINGSFSGLVPLQ